MPQAMPQVNPLALLLILGLLTSVVVAWTWAILRFALGGRVIPRFEPRVVPWGAGSVLATLVAWLAVQVLVLRAYLTMSRGSTARLKDMAPLTPSEMMTNSALQNGVILVVVPLLLALLARARPRDFARLDRRAGWQVLQGVVAWPLAMPIVYGMMFVAFLIWGKEAHPLETAIQRDGTGGKAVIFFVAGVILAPAAEELIFRGVLLGWLSRLALRADGQPPAAAAAASVAAANPLVEDPEWIAGDHPPEPADPERSARADDPYAPPRSALAAPEDDRPAPIAGDARPGPRAMVRLGLANLATSILFAGLHYTVWPTPVPIFFLSLVLGFLYQRTGSLVAPVTLHMTFNGISTVLMFLTIGASAPQPGPTGAPPPVPAPRPVDPIVGPAPVGTLVAPRA